eukprot:365997-Pyramimonas_sp.AAC.1
MGTWTPCSPEDSPWLSFYLLQRGLGPGQSPLAAMLRDAFPSVHSAIRFGAAGAPSQHFEAGLRAQARRHRAVRRIWTHHQTKFWR